VKEAIVEIIKWIRESVRPVIVLFILSGLFLFGFKFESNGRTTNGIEDLLFRYQLLATFVFFGSFFWLATFPIEAIYARCKAVRYLKRLTEDEKNALKSFISNSRKTQSYAMSAPVARHLAQRHILKDTKNVDLRGHPVFAIEDWVYARLQANPELIGLEKKSN
jgi:hypothetical protein